MYKQVTVFQIICKYFVYKHNPLVFHVIFSLVNKIFIKNFTKITKLRMFEQYFQCHK